MVTALEGATVLVVHADHEDLCRTRRVLESAQFGVLTAASGKEALEVICAQPPLCVIIEEELDNPVSRSIIEELRADTIYGHLPVIAVISSEELLAGPDWSLLPADDYLVKPFTEQELISRINLAMARARRDRHANPLTGLPGNPTIMLEVDRRLRSGVGFAFAYVDMDYFKAFNDCYGFARGDEIIRMTARILVNTVKALDIPDACVGHIGGDDFVFLVPSAYTTDACERFLHDFDQIVVNFYDEEDRVRGGIDSVDRQGRPQHFPIMTCSIGVVDTSITEVSHIGELCTRVAEVKCCAKKVSGSNYLIDRRKR